MNNFPKPCKIKIQYDKELSKITGTREEESVVSKRFPFILFLKTLFETYPDIERRFPPGQLAFVINGVCPSDYCVLKDGDTVAMAAKQS